MVCEDGCLGDSEVRSCSIYSGAQLTSENCIAMCTSTYILQDEPESCMQEESEAESLTNLARDATFQAFVLHGSMLHLYAHEAQLPLLGIIAGMRPAFDIHANRLHIYGPDPCPF